MATNVSGDFETALRRLEEIVQKLERENVGLDESVALFREGKTLSQKCERLLKEAQTSIDAAARGDLGEASAVGGSVASASSASASAASGASSEATFFDAPQPDDDPDL